MFVASMINVLSPTYLLFVVLRYLTGLCEAGAYTASFVLSECVFT